MNIGEEHSVFLPIDLVIDEIFTRLPAKSIAKFHCVSKLCSSMLLRPRFKDLFLARSYARPRLLIALERANDELLFFSSPQPQNQNADGMSSSSSLVVPADFYMKIPREMWAYFRGFASGLIYFSSMLISDEEDTVPVIYNPLTGQYVSLPELMRYRKSYSFLGFDPVEKQFKVLFVAYPWCSDDHRILTVGKESWEVVQCNVVHNPLCEGICINGVVYYLAEAEAGTGDGGMSYLLACFDVRSETFKFVKARCFFDPRATKLINYKGKVGGIDLKYDEGDAIELCLCVLEDAENQEWSKYVYTLPENKVVDLCNVFVVGMTATGVIVLSEKFTSKPFYVFYFSPESNTIQTAEIRGVGKYQEAFETDCKVYAFVDYVEDYKFIT